MTYTRKEIANDLRISTFTLYRYLKLLKIPVMPRYRINIVELIRIKEALGFPLKKEELEYKNGVPKEELSKFAVPKG